MMMPPDHLLLLVRAAPGSARAEAALERIDALVRRDGPPVVVFFHGPAVALVSGANADRWAAAAGSANVRLWVCGTAWQRRFQGAPAPEFEVSSLARFWSQALVCGPIECYGDDE